MVEVTHIHHYAPKRSDGTLALRLLSDGQGAIKSMTAAERQAILAANDNLLVICLRVLAVAYRPL